MIKKDQRGSIFYYSVLIVGILFSSAFVLNVVLIQKIEIIEQLNFSVNAFYSADAGIEKVLSVWTEIKDEAINEGDEVIEFETLFQLGEDGQKYLIREPEANETLSVTSVGRFSTVQRGIQVTSPINED